DLLRTYPADIVCMGIGENGHLAFNDPPVADFNDPALVKMVLLDDTCRQQQVNDNCFAAMDQVPLRALTVTIPALMSARFVYCIVPGKTKAQAVFNTLHETVSELYPSTILRKHAHAILFLDRDSSELL
ncbi:MAG TPA: glucosamine-6-phosphate deaminase, partial [Chitinophaga sp.]